MDGSELRSIRKALALTQTEFGRALGIDGDEAARRAVCRYETGEVGVPGPVGALASMLLRDHLRREKRRKG